MTSPGPVLTDSRTACRLAVAALAYRVPQTRLVALMRSCREALERVVKGTDDPASGTVWTSLVVDDPEGDLDLGAVAACVDVVSVSRRRRGFGVARSTALSSALLTEATSYIMMDADGQHEASALADLLARVGRPPWHFAAAIPQRTLVHLPLQGTGVNRYLAERFEAHCVASASGRPDLATRDLQPGMFLLRADAARYLRERVRARGYAWDLEASYHLIASRLPLEFPAIDSFAQAGTSFSSADSRGNLGFLRGILGSSTLVRHLERFGGQSHTLATFGVTAVEEYCRFVQDALESPIPG